MSSMTRILAVTLMIILGHKLAVCQEYPTYNREDLKKLSKEERMALFQIPFNSLKQMETSVLINKYLEHPYVRDILAWNYFQAGFLAFAERFNGLEELLSRNDAGQKIVDLYIQRDPFNVENKTTLAERGKYSFDFAFLEMLLVQPQILTKLNGKEFELLKISLQKHNKKLEYNSKHQYLYSFPTNRYTMLLMAVLMKQLNANSFFLQQQEMKPILI